MYSKSPVKNTPNRMGINTLVGFPVKIQKNSYFHTVKNIKYIGTDI